MGKILRTTKALSSYLGDSYKSETCCTGLHMYVPHQMQLVYPCAAKSGKYHIAPDVVDELGKFFLQLKSADVRPFVDIKGEDTRVIRVYDIMMDAWEEYRNETLTAEEAENKVAEQICALV
jgi:hypothetical protein